MKTGNVILAIFLWLCIPASFIFGGLFGLFGGGIGGGVICAIGAPLIFFVLGLIVLLAGMEKKTQTPSFKPAVTPQTIHPTSSSQQVKIPEQPSHDEALQILRARYAKGEITLEQFEKMKNVLDK